MSRPPRPRRRLGLPAVPAALAVLVAAALLAGCAAPGVSRAGAGLASAGKGEPRLAGAGRTVAGRGATAGSAAACNPYAVSLRPPPGPPAVTPGSFMATVKRRGYLIAGVDQNTYHFGYLNPLDRQIEGFDIDMIKAVARAIFGANLSGAQLLSKIHFKAISDAQRIADLQKGIVDIVAHTMTITCQRAAEVDFSVVYFDAKQQVLVLKPASGTPPDLARLGKEHQKVCATRGSDSVVHIEASHAILVQVPYWTDCLVLLQQGKVAGISTDNSILDGLQAQDPFTIVTGPNLEDEPYGLAISRQHPDFVRFVNAVLAQSRADGQWAASYARWVGTPVPAPPPAEYAG